MVNDPVEVRNAPEKLFVTRFEGLQPPTLVSRDLDAIADFRARYPDMILKPLYGGGGSGVARLKPDDANLEALLELHFALGREPVICQAFLPAVAQGDKRILLVDGEPVGVVNRVPAAGQVRSNLRVGGRAEAVGPDAPRPRNLRHHRSRAQGARAAVRRHRRDRRLPDRDQRHLPHRRPAAQALHRRRRHRP